MLHDVICANPRIAAFKQNVLQGLAQPQKALSPRWLYDDRGSELFEAITRLPEYYPTRTETKILADNAASIAAFCGPDAIMLEYGAGAGVKTEIIVDALQSPRLYAPIDIAGNILRQTAIRFESRFEGLEVMPIIGDFTTRIRLPPTIPQGRRFAFFPGSTIGNLTADEAVSFLSQVRDHVGAEGRLVIGVDLTKDVATLIDAYDDPLGVTSDFNLNLLTRINRELGGTFDLGFFRHRAIWNRIESAIEMHLESAIRQTVHVAGRAFAFVRGETIHTESCRKYDQISFMALAGKADWRFDRVWTDQHRKFAVFGLV